ncbi:phenylacetate--CoA ligase family protein [Actinoplanes sp. G11-F43]|uniref:phenylacetate--CoA ligase family protein n=1 Tax=Actinoplanes sp. G11-F43 TaxID=3424130 RepID=UPI003D326CB3
MADRLLPVLWDLRRVRRRGGVAERQRERLHEIIGYARSASPFYRDLYRGRTGDLESLPVTTKAELMERYDDWCTDRAVTLAGVREFVADPDRAGALLHDRYQVVTTSGTSGVRGIFVQDASMHTVLSAITVARASGSWLTGGDYLSMLRRGNRVAAVWATGGHFAGYATARRLIRQRPLRQRAIRILSVHTPLDDLVEQVNDFQPTILNGYASAVALLAREQRAGRLHIDPLLVITSAETLSGTERDDIRAVFSGRLRDQYGCSEFMGLAHGCDRDWLHVNADWAILEPVDEAYRPVPAGQPSHTVLLTNLANRVQPIIRYDLGDSVTVRPEPCECGNRLPAIRVSGRTADVLSFSGPSGVTVELPPLALGTLADRTPGVRLFQIVRESPQRLAVRLLTEPGADGDGVWERVHEQVRALLDGHGLTGVVIERDPRPPERSPGGKFRSVHSA